MALFYKNIDLVNDIVYTNLIKYCPSILKILSKNQFLASIKGSNSVENLRKMMLYNTYIDLTDDHVYTKFG